jgi:hypothetical protein
MGAATIVSGGTGGLYTVRLEYNDGIDGQLAMLANDRAALEAQIPTLRAAWEAAEAEVSAAKAATEALVDAWVAGLPIPTGNVIPQWSATTMGYIQEQGATLAVPKGLTDAIGQMQKLAMQAGIAEGALDAAYVRYLAVITREAELDRLKDAGALTVSAWCADFTEDLSGTVATMEVSGEVNPLIGGGINIRPADGDRAAYNASYGKLQRSTLMSPAGFAWNFTMIQPWMKWKPFWRYATVTAKDEDNDTVDVTLQPILSKAGAWLAKQKDFNEPWDSSMSGVPVNYMSCGAKVFEPGDEVVIEFRQGGGGGLSYAEPFCIGFKQEPRDCWPELLFPVGWVYEPWEFSDDLTGEPWADINSLQPPGWPDCYSTGIVASGGAFDANGIFQKVYLTVGDVYARNPELKPNTDNAYWVYPLTYEKQKVSNDYINTVKLSNGLSGQITDFDKTKMEIYRINKSSSEFEVRKVSWNPPVYISKLCCDRINIGAPPSICYYHWPPDPYNGMLTFDSMTTTTELSKISPFAPNNTFTAKNFKSGKLKNYQFDRYEYYTYPWGYQELVGIYKPTGSSP